MNFVLEHFAVLQLANRSGRTKRHFVHAVLAPDDQHMLGAEALHDAYLDTDQVRMENAH